MTRVFSPKPQDWQPGLPLGSSNPRSSKDTRDDRRMPVARTDDACKMILMWNDFRLDVAWGLEPKAGSGAQ